MWSSALSPWRRASSWARRCVSPGAMPSRSRLRSTSGVAVRTGAGLSVSQPKRYTSFSCEKSTRARLAAAGALDLVDGERLGDVEAGGVELGAGEVARDQQHVAGNAACVHDARSQSGRPCSTSSTNSKRSAGRNSRNTSRSSGELTVTVQTVCFCACAMEAEASSTAAKARAFIFMSLWCFRPTLQGFDRRHHTQVGPEQPATPSPAAPASRAWQAIAGGARRLLPRAAR